MEMWRTKNLENNSVEQMKWLLALARTRSEKKMCVKNDEIESEMGKSLIHTLK